ncbi:MAG TPA: dephospho-CoA kinase [Candidatus Sulfotelmatobacter sp.]|nr:dephospho-CoA kinase [Candidatus Sulfotelmatobacter sp.]
MIVLGLTGSIGMGKSETARMFRRLGVPVYDADAAVHALYARGGAAVPFIAAAFPGAVKDGSVDRVALSRAVVGNEAAMRRIERLVHPLLSRSRMRFFRAARARRVPLVVLDIPLLFETGGQRRVDHVVVVSAPAAVQRQRVLRRAGMTAEKFAGILGRQVPDRLKRAKADFVVPTGLGKHAALQRVRRIVTMAAKGGRRPRRRRE